MTPNVKFLRSQNFINNFAHKKPAEISAGFTVIIVICSVNRSNLRSVGVYADLLFITVYMLKFNSAVNKSVQSIVRALSDISSGMNVCTALSDNYIAGNNSLSVSLLYAETLGFAVTTVLCRANSLFMCKKLQAEL